MRRCDSEPCAGRGAKNPRDGALNTGGRVEWDGRSVLPFVDPRDAVWEDSSARRSLSHLCRAMRGKWAKGRIEGRGS